MKNCSFLTENRKFRSEFAIFLKPLSISSKQSELKLYLNRWAVVGLSFWPVDEKEPLGGARESRVEPAGVVWRGHIGSHSALVEINMGPLTALRLVARDGVGVFYLQRIEINVAPKRF